MTLHELLDPDVAAGLELIPFVDLDAGNVASLRFDLDFPPSDLVARTDHVAAGDPDVRLRVQRPRDAQGLLPCVYSMHGGGYVIGSYDFDIPMFDVLCPKLGFVGVSVDYRLAPETTYPGPLDDCYRGLCWIHDHAEELGVDRERIGVMGVSAGGGLAASLALLARDRSGPAIAFQLLDSPMLDDRQITTSSQQDGLPVWSRASNTFGWRSYLGELHGRADVPYTAAPARATDVSGLPPAFISVGTLDGFRDEDVDYALRLNNAGVPTELHVYPGACHGASQIAPNADVTKRSMGNLEAWLIRRLHDR